jgi:hypothetical protein
VSRKFVTYEFVTSKFVAYIWESVPVIPSVSEESACLEQSTEKNRFLGPKNAALGMTVTEHGNNEFFRHRTGVGSLLKPRGFSILFLLPSLT